MAASEKDMPAWTVASRRATVEKERGLRAIGIATPLAEALASTKIISSSQDMDGWEANRLTRASAVLARSSETGESTIASAIATISVSHTSIGTSTEEGVTTDTEAGARGHFDPEALALDTSGLCLSSKLEVLALLGRSETLGVTVEFTGVGSEMAGAGESTFPWEVSDETWESCAMGHGEFEFEIKFSFRDGLRSFSLKNGNNVKGGTEPGSSLIKY